MAKAFAEWTVLAHEPIVKLSENLWWVRGAIPGMSLKRVMTVVRQANGDLVFHSPIALDESSMGQIESWGTPALMVVPGRQHRLDAPAYKRRYPNLRVFAPKGGRPAIEQVVAVDSSYEEFQNNDELQLQMLHGVGEHEGVMTVRSSDGVSLVFNDAVFNMDRKRDVLGFLITTLFGSAPGPRVSRLAKLALVQDRAALRADLERLAATPNLTRLIVAHENIAHGSEASAALRKAATYL